MAWTDRCTESTFSNYVRAGREWQAYAIALESRCKAAEERLAGALAAEKAEYEFRREVERERNEARADRDALRAQLDRTVPALQAGSRALALDLSEIAKAVGLTDDLAEPPQVIDHVRRVVSDRDALKAQLAGMVTREQALAAMACWATDNEEAREAYWRHDTMDDCLAAVLREKGGA